MKKIKANKLAFKLVSAALALLLLSYLVYQVVQVVTVPYKTLLAAPTTVSDDITVNGIAVRNETALGEDDGSGYSYLITDGDRVSSGSVIAYIYDSNSAAEQSALLENLSEQRAMLIKLQNSAAGSADVSAAKSDLYAALAGYAAASAQGYIGDISGYSDGAKEALAAYYRQISRDADYGERISELNEAISALELSLTGASGVLTAPQSGYFVTHCDGLETAVNCDSILNMSVGEVEQLLDTAPATSDVPKLIDGYTWYFAVVLDSEYSVRFTEGQSLTLDFAYAGVSGLSAKIVKCSTDESLGRTLVVFELNNFNAATAALRFESVTISFRDYSGVVVPRSALRIENGVTGVYIKFGNIVRFVTIDILYEAETFLVVSADNRTDSGALRLYDEIIIGGKNLYVGKELS